MFSVYCVYVGIKHARENDWRRGAKYSKAPRGRLAQDKLSRSGGISFWAVEAGNGSLRGPSDVQNLLELCSALFSSGLIKWLDVDGSSKSLSACVKKIKHTNKPSISSGPKSVDEGPSGGKDSIEVDLV